MSIFRPATARQMSFGLTILRVVTGIIFTAHGGQKLFVYGLDGVAGAFAGMGVPLPDLIGPSVAFLEFFGGFALVIGLFTRVAALGLAVTMLGAMLTVHLQNGFFNPAGIEFPMALFAATLATLFTGAGALSIDEVIASRSALRTT
ncbi:MAG: DoxX family protein [Gemmatimonadaceae bacterium]